jgi:hypothetical protein
MKIVITENQRHLLRRHKEIEDEIYGQLLGYGYLPHNLEGFMGQITWDVGSTLAGKMISNVAGGDYVTLRNQIIRYIRNNFYTELKEYWESRQPRY